MKSRARVRVFWIVGTAAIIAVSAELPAQAQSGGCDPALRAANNGACPPAVTGARRTGAAPAVNATYDTDCGTDRDLRHATGPSSGPGPLEHVPVRDQDGLGICYAESATNLVDAWRFSAGGETNYDHLSSPVASAVRSGTREWFRHDPRSVDGGEACTVAGHIRDTGSCDDRAAVSSFGGRTLSESMAFLRRYYDDYHRWLDHRGVTARIAEELDSGSEAAIEHRMRRRAAGWDLSRCIARLGIPFAIRPSVDAVERLLDDSNPLVFLEGMMANGCSGTHRYHPYGLPSCHDRYMSNDQAAAQALHARLNQPSPQPVAISFCSKALTHGRGVASVTTRSSIPRFRQLATDCGYHSALVAGQRRDTATGKCQFLIRNSWGTSCDYYAADWNCVNGDVWIDAEHLSKNVTNVQYLE